MGGEMVLRCNISPVSLYPHATQERLAKGAGHAVMALLMLLATPAAAEWHLPCLFGLLGGCSTVIPLSREYAARPVQPLNPQAALEEVNAFRAKYGLNALVLDARLSRAATIQSNDQARRDSMGHHGSDGSTIMDRAERVGYRPRVVGRECRIRAQILQRRDARLGEKFGPSGEPASSGGDRDRRRDGQD